MKPVRVVLDTNCLVSALIFSHGKAGQLRAAWQRGDVIPLVCRDTIAELIRVLGYPKFRLAQKDIESLLADILPWTEIVPVDTSRNIDGESGNALRKSLHGKAVNSLHDEAIKALRDEDDAIFVRLAQIAEAAWLVSGDRHLLELRATFPELPIVSLAEFMEQAGIGD